MVGLAVRTFHALSLKQQVYC